MQVLWPEHFFFRKRQYSHDFRCSLPGQSSRFEKFSTFNEGMESGADALGRRKGVEEG